MNETTKEQIQQSMAAYSTLLKHTGRWWLTWLFSSHYLEVFITWTWETTWSAPCRPSARCVLSLASNRDSLWCLQKDCPPPVGQQKFILQRRYLSNDEESDQGYGRIRRDADQNRRLIPIYHQHLQPNTGGYDICLWRKIWSRVWPKSAGCVPSSVNNARQSYD